MKNTTGKEIISKQHSESALDKRIFLSQDKPEVGFPVGSPISLPEFLKTSLPTIEEIEKELSKGVDKAKR